MKTPNDEPCARGQCPRYIIAFQDTLAVRAMNEDAHGREDRTPRTRGIGQCLSDGVITYALDEYDTKMSVSMANTSANCSGFL